MNATNTGILIAELRLRKNLTQEQLAELLHISKQAVSRWETGKNYPDIELLEPLAEILEISIQELLDGVIAEQSKINDSGIKDIIQLATVERKRIKKVYQFLIASTIIIMCVMLMIMLFQEKPKVLNHNFEEGVVQACVEVNQFDDYSILTVAIYHSEEMFEFRYGYWHLIGNEFVYEGPRSNYESWSNGHLEIQVDNYKPIEQLNLSRSKVIQEEVEKLRLIEDETVRMEKINEYYDGLFYHSEGTYTHSKKCDEKMGSTSETALSTIYDLTDYNEYEIIQMFYGLELPVWLTFTYGDVFRPSTQVRYDNIKENPKIQCFIRNVVVTNHLEMKSE